MTGGTFFGGSDSDGINNSNVKNYGDKSRGEVVVDDQDNIYIASSTRSSDFPTAGSPQQTSLKGVQDGIVAKFNPNLSTLLWSTYFGGSSIDGAFSITLNPNGDVYACGPTNSNDLAMTTGALNSTHQGSNDGWVARFNGNTGALIKTSYLGTGASDQAFLIDSDKNNGIYVFGQSLGAYPVSPGVYSNPGSKQFIQKLSPDLSQSVFSTVIGSGGGNINIVPTAFNVDDCLNILISGWGGNTNAPNQQVNPGQLGGNTFGMPVTNDAYQSSTDGSDFYFMVLGNDASSLVYGSYFGGNQSDEHVDGGTSRFSPDGNIYQAVCAGCGATNFPTTPGALSTQNGAANTFGCNLGVIKVNFETSITAGLDVDWNADVDTNCNTLTIKFQNTSRNANSYVWDLGNGQTSTDKEPTGTYTSFGTYTVMLIAIDTICDISDTVSMVFDHDTGIVPVADFEVNYVSCDLTREVNINNKSRKGANSFFWDFGDGNTSTQQSPQHNYANSGVYTITLIAYNTLCNNSDTLVKQVDFDYDIPPPEVRVTANPCGNGSIAVELENDSAWYSYTWEFSEGTIEQGRNPKHKFTISDTYSVYLKITDSLCNNEFEFNFTEYFLISENRLYIPTAFTPNGDLNNEEFIISGNSCLEDSEFIILNAFGEEIFRTDKPFEEFWDGTYNGQPAQEDVYVYRFNSKTITRNGYIVLYH
jgi:gliding motility-associated-like protein